MNSKLRNTNFDLLKIICIFYVLILHYINPDFGGALINVSGLNTILVHFIESLAIIAVNSFVIITGYFMIDKTSIHLKKIIKMFFALIFYAISIYFVVLILGIEKFDLNSLRTFIFSIVNRWFVIIYIVLYLLSPFINKFFHSISENQLLILLGILIFFFCVWPTFLTNVTVKDSGYGIINFIILYLIGGYIKTYRNSINKPISSLTIYVIMTLVITLLSFITTRVWQYNSIFCIISSISFFYLFKSLKSTSCKIFSYLSQCSLGIYIIHENPFIVKCLYQDIFKTPIFYNHNFLFLHLILTCLCLFISCFIIDMLRKFIFKYTIDKLVDKIDWTISV